MHIKSQVFMLLTCLKQRKTIFVYTDSSCLFLQHTSIKKVETSNYDIADICDWFLDNKLSIHFREDKTKFILFACKHNLENICNVSTIQDYENQATSSLAWVAF